MGAYHHKDWRGKTGGTALMQRSLVLLLRFIPLPVMYFVMGLVIPFYMIFDRRAFVSSFAFYKKRIGRGPVKSFFSVYRNEFALGQVVLDRFAMYAGKNFRIVSDDMDTFAELTAMPEGFLQLFAHVGNPEMAGYALKSPKTIYTLVYAGETEQMMKGRSSIFSKRNVVMVPVREDMSHIFTMNEALANGNIACMPADRLFGSQKSLRVRFFGQDVSLPAGPFTLAAARNARAYALFVMKDSMRTYHVYHKWLPDISKSDLSRNGKLELMATSFAGLLEEMVRKYPYQWFNFYDFWNEAV
ncbi:MAG: acyltransferase [Bacteroidales bacterium]|nr:acyltransferase [Bacteroidales bacterium]